MRSVICMATALASGSLFESSSFRAIELFFFCFFFLISILVSYIASLIIISTFYTLHTRYNNSRIYY